MVLVLMLLGALPAWPHSKSWGYYRKQRALGLVWWMVVFEVLLLLEQNLGRQGGVFIFRT